MSKTGKKISKKISAKLSKIGKQLTRDFGKVARNKNLSPTPGSRLRRLG